MAWRIDGQQVLDTWAAACNDFDALFIVVLWLQRIRESGPAAEDDVIGGVHVYVEGPVMIRYLVDEQAKVLSVASIIDIS